MGKSLLNFTVACPKYTGVVKQTKTGKISTVNTVISLNNVNKWYRYKLKKIVEEYKENLTNWFIPKSKLKLTSAFIEINLYRENKRKFDADNLGYIVKWTIDTIKEQGWLKDDDQVTILLTPSIYKEDIVETSIEVSLYE